VFYESRAGACSYVWLRSLVARSNPRRPQQIRGGTQFEIELSKSEAVGYREALSCELAIDLSEMARTKPAKWLWCVLRASSYSVVMKKLNKGDKT
jgi:hypothetical protein